MNIQQKKLMAIAAVVLFHGTVITVMLAQHGCKSDATKPSDDNSATPMPPTPVAAVVPPAPAPANDGFVDPTRPPPETPVTPIPVAQFTEPLPPATHAPVMPAGIAPAPAPTPMTITYVVEPNDNLNRIAAKNKITVGQLLAANAPKVTRTTVLHPGDKLNIPNVAPAPAMTAPTTADAGNTYKVVARDSLSKIAAKFHTTVKALQELNGLKTTTIFEGQMLKVPEAGASTPEPATAPAPSTASASAASSTPVASDANTYTMKSGDTVAGVAKELHLSTSELMNVNGLTEAAARGLRPGHVLKLPAGASAPAPAASSATTSAPPPAVTVTAMPSSSTPPPVTMPVMAVPASTTGEPPVTPVQ